MVENVTEISKEKLLDEVQKIKGEGYRFVTASCVDMGSEFIIYYHFDQDNKMKHLKITSKKDEDIPSISRVYLAGALVENEMKDLFGVKLTDLAIDYGGKFLITGDVEPAPFAKHASQSKDEGGI